MPAVKLQDTDTRKRARTERVPVKSRHATSRIFRPFRAIGHVSNHIPFDIQIKGTQFLLTTCIGRSIQTYDCAHLNLLFVSKQLDHPIKSVVSQSDLILVASGPYVLAFKRGKEVWRLGQEDQDHITQLHTFGNYICVITTSQELVVYTTGSSGYEVHTTIALRPDIQANAILHPATYLNKIVVASSDGTLELWNIRTGTLIHRTESFGAAITAITSSPVADVIGIGLSDGTIIVHHLRADENMFTFKQEGRVNSITFRTDGQQIMATANDQGQIAFWDLEKSKLSTILRTAHAASISSIHFLNGQPILVSAGADNAVREWIFDALDGTPRHLRSRTGHHAPPTMINFYGHDSHFILSASRDRSLLGFSVYRDAQTSELSQGSVQAIANKTQSKADELKLPEIIALASQTTREKDWDNVLTAHKDDSAARSWNWLKRRLGAHTFTTRDKTAVRSVAISACGNFGFIGSYGGLVDCFNMQSGLHRRTYRSPQQHTKAITGIASDALNRVMMSCSLDGSVKFWDFHKGTLLSSTNLKVGITSLLFNGSSDLVALACDDFAIRLLDTETKKIVREFWGHSNRITSIAFSDDGRWLVSASLDGTIRTFDLPTGHTIDAFRTPSVCTALTFSPSGEYLATAHLDSVGIHLWSNKAQFSQISTRNVDEDEIEMADMPSASGEGGAGIVEMALERANNDDDEEEEDRKPTDLDMFTTMDQLSHDLLTMSMVPRSKWQNLLDLDTIRQRNKPKEAPKAPEKLPFDLGTLRNLQSDTITAGQSASVSAQTGAGDDADHDAAAPKTRHLALLPADTTTDSDFTLLLHASPSSSHAVAAFFTYVKTLGPAQIDTCIRTLSPVSGFHDMTLFVRCLTRRLEERRDYELCQVYMATFFKAHGDIIAEALRSDAQNGESVHPDDETMQMGDGDDVGDGDGDSDGDASGTLERALEEWRAVQQRERERLSELVGYCTGVLKFFVEK